MPVCLPCKLFVRSTAVAEPRGFSITNTNPITDGQDGTTKLLWVLHKGCKMRDEWNTHTRRHQPLNEPFSEILQELLLCFHSAQGAEILQTVQ